MARWHQVCSGVAPCACPNARARHRAATQLPAGGRFVRIHPSIPALCECAVHHMPNTLPEEDERISAARQEVDPRAVAPAELTMEHVLQAAAHGVAPTRLLYPRAVPRIPSGGEVAVEEDAGGSL